MYLDFIIKYFNLSFKLDQVGGAFNNSNPLIKCYIYYVVERQNSS